MLCIFCFGPLSLNPQTLNPSESLSSSEAFCLGGFGRSIRVSISALVLAVEGLDSIRVPCMVFENKFNQGFYQITLRQACSLMARAIDSNAELDM